VDIAHKSTQWSYIKSTQWIQYPHSGFHTVDNVIKIHTVEIHTVDLS